MDRPWCVRTKEPVESKILIEMTLYDKSGRYGAPDSTYRLIKHVDIESDGIFPVLPAACIAWKPLWSNRYRNNRP